MAPTAKIPDDATYPVPTGPRPQVGGHGPASIPPGFNPHAPASIPPTSQRPKTPVPQESFARAVTPPMQTPPPGSLGRAPTTPRPDSRPPTQQRSPVRAAASMDESIVTPPSRPIGLMIAILVLDLGLAAAGAVMLGKGLSANKARQANKAQQKDPPKTDAKPVQKSEAAPPPAAPHLEPAAASAQTLVAAAADDAGPAKIEKEANSVEAKTAKASGTRAKDVKSGQGQGQGQGQGTTPKSTATSQPTGTGPVTHPGAGPEDPYGDAQVAFDLHATTEQLAKQSQGSFSRCEAQAVHGSVKIAFQVLPDGSVGHATPVENTTADTALGPCLANVISAWRYTPHAGAVVNLMRPFNYP